MLTLMWLSAFIVSSLIFSFSLLVTFKKKKNETQEFFTDGNIDYKNPIGQSYIHNLVILKSNQQRAASSCT